MTSLGHVTPFDSVSLRLDTDSNASLFVLVLGPDSQEDALGLSCKTPVSSACVDTPRVVAGAQV